MPQLNLNSFIHHDSESRIVFIYVISENGYVETNTITFPFMLLVLFPSVVFGCSHRPLLISESQKDKVIYKDALLVIIHKAYGILWYALIGASGRPMTLRCESQVALEKSNINAHTMIKKVIVVRPIFNNLP